MNCIGHSTFDLQLKLKTLIGWHSKLTEVLHLEILEYDCSCSWYRAFLNIEFPIATHMHGT